MAMGNTGFDRNVNPAIGAPVFTSDGDKLGEVKETWGDYFKLDVSMQPDYWLRNDEVTAASAERVVMRFDKDHLGDYKVDDPQEHQRTRYAA